MTGRGGITSLYEYLIVEHRCCETTELAWKLAHKCCRVRAHHNDNFAGWAA